MKAATNLGFLPKPLMIEVGRILPLVKFEARLLATYKFRQIKESIAEIGLIEPLVVTAVDRKTSQHLILDGHLRFMAMKELELTEIPCLISVDDESYTYNNQLNRLSTIQEHIMIRRAMDRGISAAKLAKGLCVDVSLLQRKRSLLDGICDEVARILKDRQFSPDVTAVLRQMKPTRQIECAELMAAANTVTGSYARAMLMATSEEMLVAGKRVVRSVAISLEQVALMEKEMTNLHSQYKLAERSHSEDMLNLMLARGYIVKLIDNARVLRYMQTHFPEVLEEFGKVVDMTTVDI